MSDKSAKRRFTLTLTKIYVEALDQLVEKGLYMEHQDAIRAALRVFFRLHGIEAFTYKETKLETEDVDQKG